METRNVNITPGGTTPVIHVSQNDVGRSVTINVTDGDGWYDLTGSTVKLQGIKPSGLGYTVEGTVSGHSVTIVTTKQMTDEHGNIASELKVTKNNTVIGTANIILAVERDPHPDSTTDGSADELISELTILVERVEAAVAKEEVLHEAEAWAVGERDGVPVDEEDPTYHNNSKWYTDQAKSAKIDAANSEAAAAGHEAGALGYKNAAANAAGNAETSAEIAQNAAAAAAAVFTQAGEASYSIDEDNDLWLNITISE